MPDTMVTTDVIKSAVQLACRAPSLHNSQPWRWIAEDHTVALFLDKDRVLYATDHLAGKRCWGAAPYSTTFGWRWRPRVPPPMWNGFPTPTILCIWRQLTSARPISSPRATV